LQNEVDNTGIKAIEEQDLGTVTVNPNEEKTVSTFPQFTDEAKRQRGIEGFKLFKKGFKQALPYIGQLGLDLVPGSGITEIFGQQIDVVEGGKRLSFPKQVERTTELAKEGKTTEAIVSGVDTALTGVAGVGEGIMVAGAMTGPLAPLLIGAGFAIKGLAKGGKLILQSTKTGKKILANYDGNKNEGFNVTDLEIPKDVEPDPDIQTLEDTIDVPTTKTDDTDTEVAIPELAKDLNTTEAITGYVVAPNKLDRDQLVAKVENDPEVKIKTDKYLEEQGVSGDTVPIYRLINVEDKVKRRLGDPFPEVLKKAEIGNESIISGSLTPKANIKTYDFFEPKVGVNTTTELVRYDVPRDRIKIAMGGFKNDIKQNVNKKLKEKGFGQEKISGLKTVTNPSKTAKELIDMQDEIIADVTGLEKTVLNKGPSFGLSDDVNAARNIINGKIKTVEDYKNFKGQSYFALDRDEARGLSNQEFEKANNIALEKEANKITDFYGLPRLGATKQDEGIKALEKKDKVDTKPRDESSGHAADYVPANYGPPAHDMNMVIEEEFTPEGYSTFSTEVGDNYEDLGFFITSRRGTKQYDEEVAFLNKLKEIKDNPDAEVTIYRASPTDDLRAGDLVTPIKSDAENYVEQSKVTRQDIRDAERERRLQGDEPVDLAKEKSMRTMEKIADIFPEPEVTPSKVFTYKVKAKDLRWDGNNGLVRWGYFPEADVVSLKADKGIKQIDTENKGLGYHKNPYKTSVQFFNDVVDGKAKPLKQYEYIIDVGKSTNEFSPYNNSVINILDSKTKNFANHINTSIPTFKEAQIATIQAASAVLPKNAKILDIGPTEGGFMNTLGKVRKDIQGLGIEPSEKANRVFGIISEPNMKTVKNAFSGFKSEYNQKAFKDDVDADIDITVFDNDTIPDKSLDMVSEKFTFQFIDNERASKIDVISKKLKDDGFAIFEEKFVPNVKNKEYEANEAKKDKFKSNYYKTEDMTKKKEEVLLGMEKNMVDAKDFEEILKGKFKHVVQYWDSGNFSGYIVSNSEEKVKSFLNNMPSLKSEYSNVKPNRVVQGMTTKTEKVEKKALGGFVDRNTYDWVYIDG